MVEDKFQYDIWFEEALRQVIHRSLALIADEGLYGDHHFYVTFKTENTGVRIPPYLSEQHPDEMTIVLQHQFDNLTVTEQGFSVELRFNGKPEKLEIPFDAVTSFADPSVNFGLQLKTLEMDEEDFEALSIDPVNSSDAPSPKNLVSSDKGDKKNRKTGEVIALDTFRKK
ncbi:MAG: hypothetical protein CBB68_12595 [Rhodospirillaceae bacterium TMED8]|nr:hypothetical protein [Magnetovibrio sp.]OUT48947.1 MAG: hypothetical protein CBB68_12595 [Rhodospirillaceae bacterium TMED8]|tara:strand:+ start:194 stop:703 length:510 start_codon:yes stop_codon:yes gene_type:complete